VAGEPHARSRGCWVGSMKTCRTCGPA